MITDEDMKDAIARLARTTDGELLYRYLQKLLMGVIGTTDSGALLAHHGRRSLAAELMGLMAQPMAESSSARTNDPAERPVVFTVAGPVRTAPGARGAARRVTLTDAERGSGTD